MKILTYNVNNLFLVQETLPFNMQIKDVHKVRFIAKNILSSKADVVMLQEVGGLQSLEYFVHNFLHDQYMIFLTPGNTNRGIEIATIVKKKEGVVAKYIGHRFDKLENSITGLFARDVTELHYYRRGILKCICLNVHLKSQRTSVPHDPHGGIQRYAEFKKAVEIFQDLSKRFDVPVILGGDFNTSYAREKMECINAHIKDVLELDPPSETWTHIFFDKMKKRHLLQLDYLFLDEKFKDLIDPEIHRDESMMGNSVPSMPYQVYNVPSDHIPLSIRLLN